MKSEEKEQLISEQDLCNRCLYKSHEDDCAFNIACMKCKRNHLTFMHAYDEWKTSKAKDTPRVMCTQICSSESGRNCSKTLLTEITMEGVPNKKMKVYTIIDEQSNTSLVDQKVLDFFQRRSIP